VPDDVTRRLETFRAAVREELAFMKAAATIEELTARAIPLADGAGMLVPISELHATDTRLIERLAAWRAESAFAFPTRFPVTLEGTAIAPDGPARERAKAPDSKAQWLKMADNWDQIALQADRARPDR